MRRSIATALILLGWLVGSPEHARADLTLSITSPDDLTNLAVGATATFDVGVTGTAADAPGYFAASVQYDSSLFGNPVVSAGPIVPDLGGFDTSGTGGGIVNASYDDSILGTAAITSDGLFYSFTLTRLDAAATSLSFFSFSAMDDNGFSIAVSANPVSIDVGPAPTPAPANAVPEMSSRPLAILGLLLLACRILADSRAREPLALTTN